MTNSISLGFVGLLTFVTGCSSTEEKDPRPEARKRLFDARANMPEAKTLPACTTRVARDHLIATWNEIGRILEEPGVPEGEIEPSFSGSRDNAASLLAIIPSQDDRRYDWSILKAPFLMIWKAEWIKVPVLEGSRFIPGEVEGRIVQFDAKNVATCEWSFTVKNRDTVLVDERDSNERHLRALVSDLQSQLDWEMTMKMLEPVKVTKN
jgi:hypothetical protein